jgi:hypothetical protein
LIVGGRCFSEIENQEIVWQRRQGKRFDEVAEIVGCSRTYAWIVCRREGVDVRVRHKVTNPRVTVKSVLDSYDVVTVERGASGGYVATIDDAVTGEERRTPSAAMRDAVGRTQQ